MRRNLSDSWLVGVFSLAATPCVLLIWDIVFPPPEDEFSRIIHFVQNSPIYAYTVLGVALLALLIAIYGVANNKKWVVFAYVSIAVNLAAISFFTLFLLRR